MTATLFFVTNIVVLYNAYNREPQTWFCVIRQISRISKSGVFKGGISPSGLSPLALYADYPFIIRSYAIYKRQGKAPDGITCFVSWYGAVSDSTISSATYLLDVCRDHSGCDAFVCDHDGERCVNAPGGRHALYLSYRGYLGTKL